MHDMLFFHHGVNIPMSTAKVIHLSLRIGRTRILSLIGVLVLFVCFVLPITSDDVAAAPGQTRVQGNVSDQYGDPAIDADVVVVFLNKDTGQPRAKTWSGTTDGTGYYETTVWGPSDWEVGDTVQVTVTYDSLPPEVEELVSTWLPVQTVDVSFQTAIPQLGGLFGSLIALGAVAVVAVVFVRKKNPNSG